MSEGPCYERMITCYERTIRGAVYEFLQQLPLGMYFELTSRLASLTARGRHKIWVLVARLDVAFPLPMMKPGKVLWVAATLKGGQHLSGVIIRL